MKYSPFDWIGVLVNTIGYKYLLLLIRYQSIFVNRIPINKEP